MSKILIFSDLHIHERKEFSHSDERTGLNSRLIEGLDVLKEINYLAKKHKVSGVYFLGDLFELPDRVPNHVFQETMFEISACPTDFIFLLGNHDYALKKYPTPFPFEKLDRFFLIQQPKTFQIGKDRKVGLIPFQRNPKDFEEIWNRFARDKSISLVLFHQDVPGAAYSSGVSTKSNVKLETRKDVLYLGGHIHKPQWIRVKGNKVHYVGSPYQTNFGEEGEEKRVFLYDSCKNTFEEIPLISSPKFVSVNVKEMTGDVQGNYVQIVGELDYEVWKALDKREKEKEFEELGAKVVVWRVKVKRRKRKKISTHAMNDHEVIKGFLEKSETPLDKETLLDIGKGVWNES